MLVTMNLPTEKLLFISQLGLVLILGSFYLCYTEFYHVCTNEINYCMKLAMLVILVNISLLLVVKSELQLNNLGKVSIDTFILKLYLLISYCFRYLNLFWLYYICLQLSLFLNRSKVRLCIKHYYIYHNLYPNNSYLGIFQTPG